MSGVAGADRVKSRQDFDHFIQDYKRLISLFPGFVSLQPSGSYNSNPDKQDFGDIDLIVHIKSNLDKAQVKKQLQAFFMKEPETKIVPFSSEKHAGKRTYNAGELVSVRYHDDELGYSAQIDNIIALDPVEAGFKQSFLDWPAEKQGLILGMVKVATIETDPADLFERLGIEVNINIGPDQEYEFNLSSVRIELRLSTYDPELLKQGTYKTIKSEVVWQSQNFDDLTKILWQYDLDQPFDGLLAQVKQTIKNPRSAPRIKGVFASMITVKSGEVGTAKGAGKEAALAKINQTLGETRSLFRALVEADDQRRVVFAFVRFQPPTIGHELLITTVKQTAEANHCPYVIYVSKTQDHKKNPLSIEQKMQYLNRFFPGTNFVAAGPTTRTPIEAAKALNGKFNDLILVAGSDRANLRDTLEAYNHKEYEYNSIDFVSAGERDPDADDVAGVSGTNVRQMALDGDYESFKSNLPGSADDATAEQLMRDIQAGMTKPARAKKTGENRDLQGTDVAWKRGMSGSAYPQTYHNTGQTGGVAEGTEQKYLWHGSRQKIPMLEPRQSVDTGGATGSNQNAIYATSDPKVAIAMGLTTPGSDTGMFPNDPQMVLFKGNIRKGENVYLHKVPFNGPDGKPQFVQGGNSREFHTIPGVKRIKPVEIKAVPVDKYLNLIRQATPADLELQKKYMKKQGVAEGFLNEANSLKGTIDSIVVHGEAIAQIYEQMKSAAKKYVDNHGELKGFSMVAAGIGSRWFQSFYFNKLQNELYALVKQAPKYSPLLLDFLKSEDSKSFGRVAKGLPGILEQIGSKLGSQELMRFGKHWAQRRSDYQAYLSGLEDDDDYDDVPQEKKPKDTTQGQQNAQAAVLINQGIKDHIPAKYQGEVRNMINRLPMEKRIIALQQAIEKFKGMNESKQGVAEALVIPDALIQGLARKFPQYANNRPQLEKMAAEILKKKANPRLYQKPVQRIGGVTIPRNLPVKSPYDTDLDENHCVPIGEELESIMAGLISIIESKHGRA